MPCGNGELDAARLADAAGRVRELAAALASRPAPARGRTVRRSARSRPGSSPDRSCPRSAASPYVVDLTQGLHPAWNPYFSGLPEVFARVAPGSDGVVLRGPDDAALAQARLRPQVVRWSSRCRTRSVHRGCARPCGDCWSGIRGWSCSAPAFPRTGHRSRRGADRRDVRAEPRGARGDGDSSDPPALTRSAGTRCGWFVGFHRWGWFASPGCVIVLVPLQERLGL